MSRLIHTVVCRKIEAKVHPHISPVKFGFQPGRSTSQGSFLLQEGNELAGQRGHFVFTVEECALDPGLKQDVKETLLVNEAGRRRDELRAKPSLAEVIDLLDSPNQMPLICEHRSRGCQLRVRAAGGVKSWFGYQASGKRTQCPHPGCRKEGGFTVRHLVAECSASKEVRDKVWQQALECLKAQGVVDETCLGVLGKEEKWYRRSMGAAVSGVFEKLALDLPRTLSVEDPTGRAGRRTR